MQKKAGFAGRVSSLVRHPDFPYWLRLPHHLIPYTKLGYKIVTTEVVKVREGKGIMRFTDGNQRKMQTFSVPVNLTIAGGGTVSIDFTFPEVFGASPIVWVGNVLWGGGGFAELVMSLAQITDGKGKLIIYNPKSSSQSPNFTVNIIAMGAE